MLLHCIISAYLLLDQRDKPEVHTLSKESDAIRSNGKEMNMLKNRVHAILTRHGIIINATDIFGRRGIRSILEESSKFPAMDRIVLSDMIERISDLKEKDVKGRKVPLNSFFLLSHIEVNSTIS